MFEKLLIVKDNGKDRIFLYDKEEDWVYDQIGDAPARKFSKPKHLLPPYITDPSQMKTDAARQIVAFIHKKYGVTNNVDAISS